MSKQIPWGTRIEGKLFVQCLKCKFKWWYTITDMILDATGEKGEIVCEIIGEGCPNCKQITPNQVLEWKKLGVTDLSMWQEEKEEFVLEWEDP